MGFPSWRMARSALTLFRVSGEEGILLVVVG
jgi:hypothetical protein